jgi:hypothetical protein
VTVEEATPEPETEAPTDEVTVEEATPEPETEAPSGEDPNSSPE